jgi:hypothetical protein
MALAFYFAPKPPMSAKQYGECIKRLKKAGAEHPRGRLYHSSFGSPDSLAVFDVWTSQAAFEAFGKILMPIMQQIGADPGQPHVMPVHNVIVPPAATRPAARPRVAARKGKAKVAGKSKKR